MIRLLKYLRFLLFPLAVLYGTAIWLRNVMFNLNILKSVAFDIPVFCIGNITVGGTGKTPVAEYLIEQLKSKFNVAFLSRGYKRKSSGFIMADNNSLPETIGDEPFQIKTKYPGVYYREAKRLGGKGFEKVFYIVFK